jgi:hypothetical protein
VFTSTPGSITEASTWYPLVQPRVTGIRTCSVDLQSLSHLHGVLKLPWLTGQTFVSHALSLRTRILREGRRLLLVEADLMAEESVFSRARALLLSAGEQTGKQNLQSWNNPEAPVPPCRLEIEQNKEGRQYWSEEAGWTGAHGAHENGSRKAVWVVSKERVKGERLSPFQLISSAADLANQVVNTNSLGLAHINADVSISIARLPLDDEIGVASLTRVEAGSVVVGSALLYDRRGIIGTTTVTSLPAAGTALSFSS